MTKEEINNKIEALSAEQLKVDLNSERFTEICRELNALAVKRATAGKAAKGKRIDVYNTNAQPRNSFHKQ